jgi:dihydrofolate reductase
VDDQLRKAELAKETMRRLIVSNVTSLDGFFEGPNREMDWITLDEEFFAYAKDMLRSTDTLLFGRTTYLQMAGYWPSAAKDEIADHMNNLAKVVFSGTLETAEWNNLRLVKTDAAEEVLRLKQQPGKDMVILGSATLASSLLQQGLIDEYRVILNPVLIGAGNPLFKGIKQTLRLKLQQTKLFASGVVCFITKKHDVRPNFNGQDDSNKYHDQNKRRRINGSKTHARASTTPVTTL